MSSSTPQSVWQQLRLCEISCEQAISQLIGSTGKVNLLSLDRDLSLRFLRNFPDPKALPPVVPLLLWQNCYYLGSPHPLSDEHIKGL
ncbi:MAG: type II/IV secretion system protein, partial [Cyanobacteria bacterium J06626_14]